MSSKNKLQELLQKNRRKLPTYSTIKEGPHHEFRFRATVTLDNGLSFQSPSFYSTIKQAENAAADVAIDTFRNPNHKPMQAPVRNQPHDLSSDSQKEVNKLDKEQSLTIVEVKERKVEKLENGFATSKSPMEISPAESVLKYKISQMSQSSAQSLCSPNIDVFPSSRIQIVSLEVVPTSPNSGKGTNKQMINNIYSMPESSGNNSNKEQGHNMTAYEPEKRQQDEELIQQSEGRTSALPFLPVRNQPHALSSDSQKEANKLEKKNNITIVEVKERKVEKPENGLATSKFSMKISPAESEMKDKISQMSQSSAQSLCSPNIDVFPSLRIQIVSLEEVPTSRKSGKATNKQMINNIDAMPESSGNNSNKEHGHNMTAYEPEIRQQDKELIQQSEGRISASPFLPEMHKNRLHEFAVRNGFDIPCYSCVREGPAHALRFKATVMFNGKAFQAPEFFSSLRQAEHAAAAVALNSLSEKSFCMDESSVCKNLLQEKAHKDGSPLPEYDTTISGQLHMPIFTCTVKFDGMTFEGKAAKTKKQAEKNAALAAWTALKTGRRSTTSTVQMLDKEKTLFCDANDSPNVQVHNHVKEEKLKQSHCQLCHVDKSTDLSVVSHSEHSQVFNTDSVNEPVHNMMNVPQNTCNDKVEQPGKKLLHTKYPRGTRIRVMPALEPIKWPLSANALSASGRPWVAVILNHSMVQSQNNTS